MKPKFGGKIISKERPSRARSRRKKLRYLSILITAVAFGIALTVGLSLVIAKERERKAELRRVVTEIAAGAADSLWQQLSRSLSSTFALATIIRQHGKIDDFPALAAEMINTYNGISNLQLQPNGIVRQIYPLAGNEKAIGHNLLQDPKRRTEALAAIESKELTLAGPFTLIQGGVAVIGRLPVFLSEETEEERFWGFTAVLIHLEDLLRAANLGRLITGGYAYTISRIDPDTGKKGVFAYSPSALDETPEFNILNPVQHKIEVPNAEWTLSVAPIDGWGKGRPFGQELALVVVVSCGLAWMLFSQLKKSDSLAHEIELRIHEISQRQRAEEALSKAHAELEKRVEERTAELSKANEQMKIEMDERKRTEEELRLHWEITKNIAEGVNLVRASDGVIVYANPKMEQIFGYNSGELIGKYVGILNAPIEKSAEEIANDIIRSLEENGIWSGEVYNIKKDGTPFWTYANVSAFEHYKHGQVWTGVVQDITERKQAEKTLRKAHNQLQKEISQRLHYENELKNYQEKLQALNAEMLRIEEDGKKHIAIELNENIIQILTITNLKLSLLKESAKSVEAVSTIDDILQYIQELIKGSRLLTYDICPPVLYTFGLEEAVSWLTNEMKEKHGLHIEFHHEGQFKTLSYIEQMVVFRAINELLMNIKKHAQVSSARVSLIQDSNNLRIDITDKGIGFDDSQMERMMLESHKYGLFNIRERIRHLGGEFKVHSEIGHGTQVTMIVKLESEEKLNDIQKG